MQLAPPWKELAWHVQDPITLCFRPMARSHSACVSPTWNKDIPNRNPIFAHRSHTDISAVIIAIPTAKVSSISRNVGSGKCSYTSYYKRFVDINLATNWVKDFRHNIPSQHISEGELALTGRSYRKTSSRSLQR